MGFYKSKGPFSLKLQTQMGWTLNGDFPSSPSTTVGFLRPQQPSNPEKFRCGKWYRSGLTMEVVLKGGPWQTITLRQPQHVLYC